MSTRHVPSLYLDACVFIYFLEDHPKYAEKAADYFKRAESGRAHIFTSALTLHEVMTAIYRRGDEAAAEEPFALLTTFPNVVYVPYTLDIADRSAQIRAFTHLPTPDAIHVATALEVPCKQFITNDRRIRAIPEIEIIQLK